MTFKKHHKYLLSTLSGILMTVSFPFTGSLYLAVFISWVPLLLVEHDIFLHKGKWTSVLGYSFFTFLIFNVGTCYWMLNTKGAEFAIPFVFLSNAMAMAITFTLYHGFKRLLGKTIGSISLFIVWIGFEHLHYHWEMSWPWINIGNTFSVIPEIIQWYSITGILGGVLWILLINFIFFIVLSNLIFQKKSIQSQFKMIMGGIALFLIPTLWSWWIYTNYKSNSQTIEVVIIQPNVDTYKEKFTNSSVKLKEQLDQMLLKSEELITDKTSVILTPESAITIPYDIDNYINNPAFKYLQNYVNSKEGVSMVTGALTTKEFDKKTRFSMRARKGTNTFFELYDDLIYITDDAPPIFYHKSQLVIGTEKVPYAKWLPFLETYAYNTGNTAGTIGIEPEPKIIESKNLSFAPVICYESAYGWQVAQQCKMGAEVIFIITNDDWWGNTPGHRQHNGIARLRAIENRRDVARSANTGISSIINARGDIVQATQYKTYDGIVGDVHLNTEQTFYTKHGDFLGYGAIYCLYILVTFTIVKVIRSIIQKPNATKSDTQPSKSKKAR